MMLVFPKCSIYVKIIGGDYFNVFLERKMDLLRIITSILTAILLLLLLLHSVTHIISMPLIKIILWPTVLLLIIHYALKNKNKKK